METVTLSTAGHDRWWLICGHCGQGRVHAAVEVSWRRVRWLPASGERWIVDGQGAALAAAMRHEEEHNEEAIHD